MEHKQVTATVTETDQGVFTAIAAAYTTDRQHERISRGAFARTIAAWQDRGRDLPLHWDHGGQPSDIIGNVDPHSMREVSDGLYIEGQLDLDDSETARQAWRLVKRNVVGLSFGYMVNRDHADDGVTVLDELDVFEITLTPAPANPDARVLSAKSVETPDEVAAMSDEELRAKFEELLGKDAQPIRIASFEC